MKFYILFATDKKFLGATVVDAENSTQALQVATEKGLNPGGEAMVIAVPKESEKAPELVAIQDRLAGEEEMMGAGGKKVGGLDDDDMDVLDASQPDIICQDCNGRAIN